MNRSSKLPIEIARFIGYSALIADEIGESPASVFSFDRGSERFFLKTSAATFAPTTYSVLREARVLQWLDGRLDVPEVVVVADTDQSEFMITRCVLGEPIGNRLHNPAVALELFREALRQLQAVSIADCPFDSSATVRLTELQYLLAHDLHAKEHDLNQWPNLNTPELLMSHLRAKMPNEQPVFSHGDLCDANVFVDAKDQLHFIDLGRGGIADRWLDIAFIHRNLSEDISQNAAEIFLEGLGECDEPARREFFEQLDELF